MTHAYLLLKYVHVLSSVVLVGTGFGTAFYLFFANRSGKLPVQAEVARLVVRADWWFTTPAAVIQPLTGLWLAHLAGWPLDTPWIAGSLLLYALAMVLWLPAVWLQLRMERLARQALAGGGVLPPAYQHLRRRWETLGYPAFFAMLVIFWLMVAKPS